MKFKRKISRFLVAALFIWILFEIYKSNKTAQEDGSEYKPFTSDGLDRGLIAATGFDHSDLGLNGPATSGNCPVHDIIESVAQTASFNNAKSTNMLESLKSTWSGNGIVVWIDAINVKATFALISYIFNSNLLKDDMLQRNLQMELFYESVSDFPVSKEWIQAFLGISPLVKVVDISDILPSKRSLYGPTAQSFAILASSFENAILLDPNVLPLQSLSTFLSSDSFKKNGILFFPAFNRPEPIDFYGKWTQEGKRRGGTTDTDMKMAQYQIRQFRHARQLIKPLVSESRLLDPFFSSQTSTLQDTGILVIDKVHRIEGIIENLRIALCKLPERNLIVDRELFWIGFSAAFTNIAFEESKPLLVKEKVDESEKEEEYGQGFYGDGRRVGKHDLDLDNRPLILYQMKSDSLKEQGAYIYGDAILGMSLNELPVLFTRQYGESIQLYQKSFSRAKQISKSLETIPKPISPWSYSSAKCSDTTYNYQFHHWLQYKLGFWRYLQPSGGVGNGGSSHLQIYKHRKMLHDAIATFERDEAKSGPVYEGKGIIYSCHPGIMTFTMISIKMIRGFGCNLPIEVWHSNELHKRQISTLRAIPGVSVHNLAQISHVKYPKDKDGKTFQLKTAAILHSSLDKVLFLDGDNVPTKDPTYLFDHPAFLETGALFWKDFWKTRPDNPLWDVLGLDCVDEYEQESGQMVFHKSKPGVVKGLKVALEMQSTPSFYFHLTAGDKDTYRLAWRMLGLPYHMIDAHIGVLGPVPEPGWFSSSSDSIFCGHTMVQYAPFESLDGDKTSQNPEILFLHSNQLKYESPTLKWTTTFGPVYRFENGQSGLGRFGPGICVSLIETPQNQLVLDNFKDIHPGFENTYRTVRSMY